MVRSTHGQSRDRARKPFPTQQMFILALCRICEPISFTSIFPYIYQMIASFGTAKTDNEIGIYAGMVTSAFALAEFSTGMLWGRVSDKFGRKPVLIMGLVGTLLSNVMFGFAKNFPVALLARALGGGLNGNVGVIQTTVAELVREKEHQPRAFAAMPFVWCLGSIMGPSIGGLLAEPTKYYPHIFPPGGLLEEYPYLLPNLVASAVLVVGIAIGILFLEETHGELKLQPDIGVRTGRKILNLFKSIRYDKYEGPNGYESPPGEETEPLLAQEAIPPQPARSVPMPTTKAFTRPVVALIVSYGILAYHSMGFEQLFPIFLSTPAAHEPPRHLFKFTGGLSMGTQEIGFILTMQGAFSMITQFLVFPPIAGRFGILSVYRFCMWTYALSYVIVPYLDFLPERVQLVGVYLVLAIKILYGVLAYPCNAILLTNAAPSLLVLGSINGVAASCASLARSISPTVTGMINSYGLENGIVGLSWWVNAIVCLFGGLQCMSVRTEDIEGHHTEELSGPVDEEAAEHIAAEIQVAHTVVRGEECFDQYSIAKKAIDDEIATLGEAAGDDDHEH